MSGYECTAFCYDEELQRCQLGRKGPVKKTSMYATNLTCHEWPGKSLLVFALFETVINLFQFIDVYNIMY